MYWDLMWDGLKAMILGMGMVYIFLIIMIYVMKLTSKMLAPYAKYFEPKNDKPVRKKAAAAPSANDAKLAQAAISAVELYRKNGVSPVSVPVDGKNVSVKVVPGVQAAPEKPAAAAAPVATGDLQIVSPLPGTIVRIEVAVGDAVAAGDVLAVVEAMKMETEIRAEKAGTVTSILVNTKDVVTSEQPILTLGVDK